MPAKRTTIRRQLLAALMITSGVMLLLTSAAFFSYDVVSSRRLMARRLVVRAEILATNLTASLAFDNEADAREVLAALKMDPHTLSACLYDGQGRVFAVYPDGASIESFPGAPEQRAARFERSFFVLFQPIMHDRTRLGTLYLKSDLSEMTERVRLLVLVVAGVAAGCVLIALLLSLSLQRRIAQPILDLAYTAKRVAENKDYSVRALKLRNDELGVLTDCFNEMLDQIKERESSLRKSEAGLRAVLESALDSIVTMDHKGRVVEFNPAAEETFGYSRLQAVGAQVADLIMPPEQREGHRAGLARYLATGESAVLGKRIEMTAMRADGSTLPVELAISRVAQEGQPLFTGFIRDITDRKRAEQEIRLLNEDLEKRVAERTAELEAANKELEAFSYSVSHDLRAPLRGIDGFSQAVLEDCGDQLNEEGRGYLERVRAGCRKMAGLIDDMLALARITRREMQRQPVDLSALASSVSEELKSALPERTLEFDIQQGVWGFGDRPLLRIALENLLGNACKFTKHRPEARIEFGVRREMGSEVYFVRDNGAGFDMRHKDKLFGAFQRLHSQHEFEGSGIGLATVSRVIHRHGGRVWAESELDRGATFYFSLGKDVPCEEKSFSLSKTMLTTKS